MKQIGANKPDALWPQINSELNRDSPPWDDLKPQTDNFAKLAADVGANDPPKGKDTWQQDAKAFADLAAALNAAVAEKDLVKAKDAQNKVHDACDNCHRAHRGRPGG
ncbi:MAG TPA: cytochrome c [Gemmataceae bacterium]|nr:cytochrome c [Gemmataceae bacterium]